MEDFNEERQTRKLGMVFGECRFFKNLSRGPNLKIRDFTELTAKNIHAEIPKGSKTRNSSFFARRN